MTRWRLDVGFAILLIGVSPSTVSVGQSTSLRGRVVAGAKPAAGVVITAIEETARVTRHTTTLGDGTYRFDDLTSGLYRIDFDFEMCDLLRRNHVRVDAQEVQVDAALRFSPLCECVEWPRGGGDPRGPALRERAGQVVDDSGRPLPHARLEVVSAASRETAYADGDGRFRVRLSANTAWPLTASESGFQSVTQQVRGASDSPIVFRLPKAGPVTLDAEQVFGRGCRCWGDLFTHRGR